MNRFFRILALSVFLPLAIGCARYSKVSPGAYQYTKALYSVCNRHDEPRLDEVARQIRDASADSQLSAEEVDWMEDIIATAQAGDWQVATKDARRLMEAQVEGRR